jgi:prophage antirepressor-like protein
MSNLTIFNNERFGEIRTVTIDGEPWFVLKDICAAFGEQNYRRVASRLDEEEKGVSRIDTLGGAQDMTVVNESGVYAALFAMQPNNARNVSDEYIADRTEKLKAFKRWVTHDVLPSIRKTGGYVDPKASVPTVRMSDALAAMANVARLAEDNQRRLDAIEASTKELDSKLDKAAEAFTAPSFAADKWQENARATIAAIVQENGLSYQAYTGELYQRLESVACVNLKSRQSFKQKRMKEQGATYRDRQSVTKLNVIADDPKLRAVFDHILAMEKASRLMKGGRTA